MIKSWKTTLAGILAVLPTLAHTLYPQYVTTDVATAITTIFVAIGLVAAKDGNVTGGTTPQ